MLWLEELAELYKYSDIVKGIMQNHFDKYIVKILTVNANLLYSTV